MSFSIQTKDGSEVEASFIGVNPAGGVRIGEYEIPLKDFCAMAAHFLCGGFFGWSNNETPGAVNMTLSNLFELYEQVDGKWTRKEKYRMMP